MHIVIEDYTSGPAFNKCTLMVEECIDDTNIVHDGKVWSILRLVNRRIVMAAMERQIDGLCWWFQYVGCDDNGRPKFEPLRRCQTQDCFRYVPSLLKGY